MNDILKYLSIAASLLPFVRQSVELAEDLGSGLPGVEKKELAVSFITALLAGLKSNPNIKIKELDVIPFDIILLLVGQLIEVVVTIFNKTLWKK